MQAYQKRRESGFTILELLIAVGIVMLLMAILIPVQQNARVVAKRSQCASNLRQIGIGLKLYGNENAGAFPLSTHTTGSLGKAKSWIFQLENYIGDVDEVRICPAEPAERQASIRQRGATSYAANDLVMDSPTFNNQFWIPQPARTLLMLVLSEDRTPSLTRDHIHGAEWVSWAAMLGDAEPDRHRIGDRSADRLSGSSNYLYVDGHVEVIEASEFQKQFAAGKNPAEPPL